MPNAADALRLSSSRTTLALGDMTADQILAGMNDDQKAALTASLAADANAGAPPAPQANGGGADPEPDPNDPNEVDEDEKAKNKNKGGANDGGAEASSDYAKGFAAATERARTVMSSEHFEGRASHAHKLLGNAKLSGDEIVGMLADMPDGSGQQMLDALKGQNPNLGTGAEAGGKPSGQQAQSVWDKAIAKEFPTKK